MVKRAFKPEQIIGKLREAEVLLWGTRHSYCEEQYLEALKAAESFYVEDGELQITSGKLILIYAEENSGILQGLVTIGPINSILWRGLQKIIEFCGHDIQVALYFISGSAINPVDKVWINPDHVML